MKYFFSVDWGTSSLRVRFVSTHQNNITLLQESTAPYGCSTVDATFKEEKRDISREDFFLEFLKPLLQIPYQITADNPIPVIISGMAASGIGIRELPYSPLPFSLKGTDLKHAWLPRSVNFKHPVLLLSGLSSKDDVMRGEEMQLLGLQQYLDYTNKAICVLPGTHSKHILVKDQKIISFKTYITGELFHLLSTYSLLKNSITKTTELHIDAFRKGLELSRENILNTAFTIRAGSLLHNADSVSNYSLLSGILIGTELRTLADTDIPVFLCAHENLSLRYSLAIQALSLQEQCRIIPVKEVDESVIYGQKIMLETLWKLQPDFCHH